MCLACMHTSSTRLDDTDFQACRGRLTCSRETARHRRLNSHKAIHTARGGANHAAHASDIAQQAARLDDHGAAHRHDIRFLGRRTGKEKGASERWVEHGIGLYALTEAIGMLCSCKLGRGLE